MNLPKRAEIEKAARHLYELLDCTPAETRRNCQAVSGTRERGRLAVLATGSRSEPDGCWVRWRTSLETKRLLIVAEGALQYLPFGALPAPQGKATLGLGQTRRHGDTRRHRGSSHCGT